MRKKNFKKYIEEYFEWNEEERKEMYYNNLKNYLGEYNILQHIKDTSKFF